MMPQKTLVLTTCFLMSLNIYSLNDQCPTPGETVAKDFIGKVGKEKVSTQIQRKGTSELFSTFSKKVSITTEIYNKFQVDKCERTFSIVDKKICAGIDTSTALGRGNSFFKYLFSNQVSIEEKATLFISLIAIEPELKKSERILIATDLINLFNDWAIENSIPQDIKSYGDMLNSLEIGGTNPLVINQLKTTQNVEKLGLLKLDNILLREGTIKESFNELFDRSISISKRVKIFDRFFQGHNLNNFEERLELTTYLAAFANFNGIPENWSEVVNMFAILRNNDQLSEESFTGMTERFEEDNRTSLGLNLQATLCETIKIRKNFNKIVTSRINEFDSNVTKNFNLTVEKSLLLEDETESFSVTTNGLNKHSVSANSRFNSYNYTVREQDNGDISFNLTAKRVLKRPENTFQMDLKRKSGGNYTLSILDKFKHQELVEGVTITAKVFQHRPLWFDKEIGSATFNYKHTGKKVTFDTKVKDIGAGKQVYILFNISKRGPLFNSSKSIEYKLDL